jgi:hypothetical protein
MCMGGLTMPQKRIATMPESCRPSATMYEVKANRMQRQDSRAVSLLLNRRDFNAKLTRKPTATPAHTPHLSVSRISGA